MQRNIPTRKIRALEPFAQLPLKGSWGLGACLEVPEPDQRFRGRVPPIRIVNFAQAPTKETYSPKYHSIASVCNTLEELDTLAMYGIIYMAWYDQGIRSRFRS